MLVNPVVARVPSTEWDPSTYLKFAQLRERPVIELLDHIAIENPQLIHDLGCGTGIATQLLAKRWPNAELIGVGAASGVTDAE